MKKAFVAIRASSGTHKYVWPIRVYLAYHEEGTVPPLLTNCTDFVYFEENARATRRVRELVARLEALMQRVNAGEITFLQAKELA